MEKTSRRPWMQFSLRSLLLLMLVTAREVEKRLQAAETLESSK